MPGRNEGPNRYVLLWLLGVELLGMSDVTCIGTSGPTDGEEGLLVATEVACLVSQGSFLCRRGSRGRRQGIDTSRGGLHGALS